MQGPGSDANRDPSPAAPEPGQEPGHRAMLQPGRAGWGEVRGGSVGGWSFQVSFHFLLNAPAPLWGGGGFAVWAWGRNSSLDIDRLQLQAVELKMMIIDDKRQML